MVKWIGKLYNRFHQIIIYMMCSLFTWVIETVLGYLFKNFCGWNLIVANTASIFVGSTIHYLLVSYKAFKTKTSGYTLFVYVVTFVLGIVLQNVVMKVSYDYVMNSFVELIRYTGSKFLSVMLPFFFLYFVRKYLYSLEKKRKGGESDE